MALIRISDRNSGNSATVDSEDVEVTITPWFSSQSVDVQADVSRLQQAITIGNQAAVDTLTGMLELDLQYL